MIIHFIKFQQDTAKVTYGDATALITLTITASSQQNDQTGNDAGSQSGNASGNQNGDVKNGDNNTGLKITLIVVCSIVVLCAACYALLFFVFNKWINKEGKVERVFAIGEKDNNVRTISMLFKIEYHNKTELFKTKEDAEKANK